MTSRDFAIAYLKAIQKKNQDYFIFTNIDIFDCVNIKGEDLVSIHITKHDLPYEIKYAIETMFWR